VRAQTSLRSPGVALTSRQEPSAGDVVFAFSHLSWDAAARRGWFGTEDRLAKGLVGHERARRVLICDRVRSLPLKLARDRLSSGGSPFPADEHTRLLSPLRLRRSDPISRRGLHRTFRAYDRAMERAAAQMGMQEPVVVTTNPLLAGFAELAWARAVTFYALDDWAAHPGYRRWWAAYRESELLMRERRRRVAAVSEVLLARLAPVTPGSVIANGLEPAEWLDVRGDEVDPPESTGPRLIYAGTLDARLDIAWLTQTAKALPAATLSLVGPILDEAHIAPLRREPNIAIHAPLARAELGRLIAAADVGLVPHVRSALTEAMSPLKLYEYLACGLPVAASDLQPMRGVDERVVLVREGGDFAAATRAALALGRSGEAARRRFVEANSWASRHDALLDLALA
jgi:teichuronic acid biosynthesis glycosyltransferase TuaH